MCCQLLATTGFVYHTHECSDSDHQYAFDGNTKRFKHFTVEDSCCGHAHHTGENEFELNNSDSRETLQHIPHHHPCNCELHTQANRVVIEVNRGASRSKMISYYLPSHADSHRYHSQNPSQAPPQKFLYTPPLRGSSGVALINVLCVYLI